MTKALVCSTNSHVGPYSYLVKLFGDPDQYAYKLGNDAYADELPIYMRRVYIQRYDFFHSVSIDYDMHRVYYSNNKDGRLEFGLFIHHNNTENRYYFAVPETNQVTTPSNITVS